ncbi:MAG: hypothetical protein AAF564_06755 [Bacteroidota bacterium]
MKLYHLALLALTFAGLSNGACNSKITSEELEEEAMPGEAGMTADVVSVSVSGEAGNYQFAVGIESPDIDCSQYANWWEVVAPDGALLYRRILGHSHPAEQPFIRSGGPVEITADDDVIIRAHMHPSGYGGTVYRGSVANGFQATSPTADFADELSEQAPLPSGCTG